MARKVKTVTVTEPGRDKGKRFELTEMPSSRAERWAIRALLAMSQSGVPVPPDVMRMGMPALVSFGMQAILNMAFAEADTLVAEMMACIKIAPDPSRPEFTRALIDDGNGDDIEEVATRFFLRSEVFELHTGFSVAAYLREQAAAQATVETTSTT